MRAEIVILPGDGIGPEVARSAESVLTCVAERFDHTFELQHHLIGGAAIDVCSDPFPSATRKACLAADAVFLGAVGGPKWDQSSARPEQGLLALRKTLGVFANLRPMKPHPAVHHASPIKSHLLAGVDLLVVRELTGGIYFGNKTRTQDSASDQCQYSEEEIVRVVRMACQLASKRGRRVTSVDKANVLETSRLWREVATRIAKEEFPRIQMEHQLVDSMAMHLLARPRSFDVIVTENMFGDILTDEASMLAGSMGLLPSASINDSAVGIYEPIHGSAPDIAGQGIANPIAAILSVAMMLRHSFALEVEARRVECAVDQVLAAGRLTVDLCNENPIGTRELTALVCRAINESHATADLQY